ncbi:MAG: alpha-amylase family glycosyl hydrolase [Steroidobacteraceae bacterium]
MPASLRPFMGASPYSDSSGSGVTFRVWAPFASAVAVAGDFNAWSLSANPLYSESNGYWSVDVAAAAVGSQYKFVLTNPGIAAPFWRMDPYARSIIRAGANLNGLIATCDEQYSTPNYSTPAWNEMVIYEMHIRTFLYSADGIDGAGSFKSAITKLDYLKDLGVNVIELLPIGEFIGDISAGYNPAYIFAIEDEYGGPDGFRQFVDAAHQRGIAVIIDVVYNHLGVPAADMWTFDGWSQNSKGGIYFYNDWRSTTDWGETRFDYGRPEVRQFLRDNALRWLEQRFADGLRWDSTGSIRNVYDWNNDPADDIADGWSLMQWITGLVAQRQPWKICIAEDMQENEWITKDTGAGGAGFDAQWGAAFVSTVRAAIIDSDDETRDMNAVAGVIQREYNGDAFQRVIYTESHDADSNGAQRVPEMIWPGNAQSWYSKKRSTLGAALVMTAPGIPMIFMGQEFLCGGWFNPDAPLDWSNAAQLPGIIMLYRDLIRLRRDWFNNTRGLRGQNIHLHHIDDGNKVIAFHRWDQGGSGDDVVVVLNFSTQGFANYTIGFPRSGLWRVRFNSDWNGYDASFGNSPSYDTSADGGPYDSMPFSANMGFGPYSAVILTQD